jgi:ubiquitin-protein ligase
MINKVAFKRINKDYEHFQKENPSFVDILPNKDNILEIYFLLFGEIGTPYEGGQYIGKIVHSPEYPLKAPDYYMLTPNGRFEINKRICLTNSSFHPETWAPVWNLVALLQGLNSVWHSNIKEDKIGVGHIYDNPIDKLKLYADSSIKYNIEHFNEIYSNFPKIKKENNDKKLNI